MTDDSLTLAEEVNAAPWWVLNSCLYPTFFSPTLRFLAPYPPPPSPWGNMAFEVNTICFVAFLWWLNNGLKYVAKWESQVEDGSNLAFFSEWWHRPIEINERAGILTLSLLQEKQQPLGSVLFTQFTGPALLKYNGINFAQVLIKKKSKAYRWYCRQDFRNIRSPIMTLPSPVSCSATSKIKFSCIL